MDDVTRAFVAGAILCFGIVAAAVGIRVYQSETLVAVIVGGVLIIATLAAVAVVVALLIRLLHVSREEREQRLIVGRTIQAVLTSTPAADGGARSTIDPTLLAALAALGDGSGSGALPGGGQAGGWTPIERPQLEVQDGK